MYLFTQSENSIENGTFELITHTNVIQNMRFLYKFELEARSIDAEIPIWQYFQFKNTLMEIKHEFNIAGLNTTFVL